MAPQAQESDGHVAFYAGSFDPLTNGHLDVLMQALALFDRVVVGIGIHPGKAPLFSFEERATLIRDVVGVQPDGHADRIEIVAFDNLVIKAAREAGAVALVRGLRDGTDLDYEMQMAGMNGTMDPDIRTVFFPASPQFRAITATLVRQVARMGGDVAPFVPAAVLEALGSKLSRQSPTE